MLSLTKNQLFAMVDTETIFMKKRIYELAVVIFDSVTCDIVDSKKWYIKETIESAVFYQLRHNKAPIFWPSRLNPLTLLKEFSQCLVKRYGFLLMLQKHDIKSLIAHNVNFDVGAIYSTNNLYGTKDTQNKAFLSSYEKLELSGFFVHGLPKMTAFHVPYKAKSGCMTFKADFIVPCLLGANQNHDAISDCYNQIQLYKIAIQGGTRYANNGTIYANMLAHHKAKHNDNKRLGDTSID